MRYISLAVVLMVAAVAGATPALALKTPFEAGMRRAYKMGYGPEQSACFANIFTRYATLGPRGGFTMPGRRSRISPFYGEIWNSCGIY